MSCELFALPTIFVRIQHYYSDTICGYILAGSNDGFVLFFRMVITIKRNEREIFEKKKNYSALALRDLR